MFCTADFKNEGAVEIHSVFGLAYCKHSKYFEYKNKCSWFIPVKKVSYNAHSALVILWVQICSYCVMFALFCFSYKRLKKVFLFFLFSHSAVYQLKFCLQTSVVLFIGIKMTVQQHNLNPWLYSIFVFVQFFMNPWSVFWKQKTYLRSFCFLFQRIIITSAPVHYLLRMYEYIYFTYSLNLLMQIKICSM